MDALKIMDNNIVIVGDQPTGLSTAQELLDKKKLNVERFEAKSIAGSLATSEEIDEMVYDYV